MWNPVKVLSTVGKGIKDKLGNPLDWGKNPIDPNEARLQDGDQLRGYLRDRLGSLSGRQAPTVGGARIDPAQQAQWRRQQMELARQLQGVASGQQMGAGELATRRQYQSALASQMAQAAAQRGGMAGLAGRSAARNMGTMTVDAAGQSAASAMQDQAAARGLLAGVAGQGRDQDLSLATNQAGFNQQANLANQAAKLQQLGMDDAAIAQTLAQMYGISLAEMQARLGVLQANQADQGYLGDLMQMGGTLGGAYLGRPG